MDIAVAWPRALLVVVVFVAAALACGRALLTAPLRGRREAWLLEIGLGTGVLAGATAVDAVLQTPWIRLLALLPLVQSLPPLLRWQPRLPRHLRHPLAIVVVALLATGPVLAALAPPVDTDELYQHLAGARRIAETGVLAGGYEFPDGSRPQLLQALYGTLHAVGGYTAVRLVHLVLAATLVIGAWQVADQHFGRGRGAIPALVLCLSYTFLHEAGLAYNDLPAALWLLLGAHLARRGTGLLAGIFLGLALSAKFTAGPAVAMVVLLAGRRMWVIGPVVALVVAPWLLRNLAGGLHPLFPYAGWPEIEGFRFMYPEKYGVGHSWADALLLPWNVLVNARLDSFAFYGQLSWGWAAIGLGGAWAAWREPRVRPWFLVLAVGFLAWGSTAQIMRFLLPLSGVALVVGAGAQLRWAALLLALASAPRNLGPMWEDARGQLPVVLGREQPEDYLSREIPAWPAIAYLRDEVPRDARVALLFAWHGYYVEQDYILGSVE
ncbi:MAG: hypothetical protein FJ090_13700, partial [Deltaproteobacteria bacterium]|nr:hypothetical protein [Deltaproteobacteria bacterium]